ncbi:MAG: hypothetical protein M5U34_03330 [Chloroflexi bacterium]|nr:hypothetical protein [Chloroflexota bacterium]
MDRGLLLLLFTLMIVAFLIFGGSDAGTFHHANADEGDDSHCVLSHAFTIGNGRSHSATSANGR